MKLWSEFQKGIIRENPIFGLVLGMCPALAVTNSITNAVGMGAAVIFVLSCSNIIIAAFRKFFPSDIRIPCYIIVVSTFVTIVQKVMQAYTPDLDEALGIFIPLIVVNCIILGRAEAFSGKNPVAASAADGLGMGIGYSLGLVWVSFFREVFGHWSLLGRPITAGGFDPAVILVMAPGAFLVLGLSIGFFTWLGARRRQQAAAASVGYALAEEPIFGPALVEQSKKAKAAAPGAAPAAGENKG
jgi:electron transport complex protein RnfE